MKIPTIGISLLCAIAARAQSTTAFSYTVPTIGNQTFAGSLGLDFDVVSPIRITHLLAFDDDADGWSPGTNISVAIYDRDTASLVTSYLGFSATNSGDLVAGSFRSLLLPTPVDLTGGSYSIVAQGFNEDDQLFNAGGLNTGMPAMDDGGGLIGFTGTGRYSLTLNSLPNQIDIGPENRYAAGSFVFEAIPEPSTVLLAACAAVSLLIRRRISIS